MSKVLIISPSGNLYGSEQVLLDFLESSSNMADVVVPRGSKLDNVLSAKRFSHRILNYDPHRIGRFYAWVGLQLAKRKYNSVYLNEAGHAKYVMLLARLFPGKKFVIHVRVAEDAAPSRWLWKPGKNVEVIAISSFIQNALRIKSTLLLDPYCFGTNGHPEPMGPSSPLRVGVIGRITHTKGVHFLLSLLRLIRNNGKEQQYRFLLFGDMADDVKGTAQETELRSYPNVSLEGFVPTKEAIYSSIDCVMHLSDCEPLGRIFFEAIEFGKPLIGMNAAGIGEIGALTGLDKLLVDPAAENVDALLLKKLEELSAGYADHAREQKTCKEAARRIFSIDHYTKTIESIVN